MKLTKQEIKQNIYLLSYLYSYTISDEDIERLDNLISKLKSEVY